MNIFFLDADPQRAAEAHCDKHVGKLLMEAFQLMAGAHELTDGLIGVARQMPHVLPKPYHKNKVGAWARATRANYEWTFAYACALAVQFELRYGHKHLYAELLECYEQPPQTLQLDELTKPWLGMPEFFHQPDPVIAYRDYYAGDKVRFARWQKGVPPPTWWKEHLVFRGTLLQWRELVTPAERVAAGVQ